jgi:signal transduction histidine kinase
LDTISELEPPPAVAAKPVLLVVDDEEGPRQSLRIVFKNDYQVLLASNGPDALEIVRNHAVDVVVCDIMMFGMSGVEVLKGIKEIDPSIEVVMLTAFETIETARQALRHGAIDYLNKPFDIPSMRSAVKRAADKHFSTVEFRKTNEHLQELKQTIHDHRVREEMARAQGEIYASVLHDINSPLTVISGFVELINRSMENAARVEGEQLARIKGDLHTLNGEVGRCFEISRRYLSFLNNNTALEAEKVRVGANQAINDLRDLLVRNPIARGNELTVTGLDEDVIADINGTDFLQILLNLTINALQSSDDPHRVDVSCQLLAEPLNLDDYPDGPDQRLINRQGFSNRTPILAISIIDEGPGIPPEVLTRMFEERFTTKPPDRGTGLGLSIVKRLIVEAKGAVLIRTNLGAGSTFTVCLPTLP